MNIDNIPVLFSTVMSLVIRSLRHQTGFEGGSQVWGANLAKKSKKSAAALIDTRRPVGELNLSACEARRLYGICVELLELCSHVSGRIDPQAGWMVAHARDEVMLGIFDVKP
jgi:hypothetical protein